MRREALLLGHPRFTFPLRAELGIQSIGSRSRFLMHVDSIRGWELSVELNPEQRPGYNPSSLLEIWIKDSVSGRTIFGFAKYLQSVGSRHMLIRIIEIDGENRDYLQELLDRSLPLQEPDIALAANF